MHRWPEASDTRFSPCFCVMDKELGSGSYSWEITAGWQSLVARSCEEWSYFRHFLQPSLMALKATRSSRLGRKIVRINNGRYQAMNVPPA
jgi:hypothetical protein